MRSHEFSSLRPVNDVWGSVAVELMTSACSERSLAALIPVDHFGVAVSSQADADLDRPGEQGVSEMLRPWTEDASANF